MCATRTDLNFTSSVGSADTFPSRGRQGCSGWFCTKSAQFRGLRNSAVSTGVSTPGTGNNRIRRCVNAPQKSLPLRGEGVALARRMRCDLIRLPQANTLGYPLAAVSAASSTLGRRKFRPALIGSGSFPVSPALSTPGYRNKRIGTALIRL